MLSGEQIHVWRINLLQPASLVQRLAQTLSADECQRARRFRFEKDHRRFIVGRGQLRSILSYYLGCTPSSIQFTYGPQGKPFLVDARTDATQGPSARAHGLQLNLSHSHELALCALVANRKIGVDLEYLRPLPAAEQIANRFFTKTEQAMIQALPTEEQANLFFRLWTGKEAYLKATGKGLSNSLDQVEIISEENGGFTEALPGWFMQSFSPATNYLAALVVEHPTNSVHERFFMGNRL